MSCATMLPIFCADTEGSCAASIRLLYSEGGLGSDVILEIKFFTAVRLEVEQNQLVASID